MSYIIKTTNPGIRVKLTEKGRQKLATGQLTFSKWAIGDSEIDYGYVNPNSPMVNEQILRPKDDQPNIKHFLTKSNGEIFTPLDSSNLQILGVTVNNPADTRGFFAVNTTTGGTITNWSIYSGSSYVKATGILSCSQFNSSGNTIDLGISGFSECDFVQFVFTNPTAGNLTRYLADVPVPYLWYKIVSGETVGTTVTLDRSLPDLSFFGACSVDIQFFIYPGCSDPINSFYGSGCTTSYWNNGTLTFDSCCEISIADVKIWNENNVWCEDMIGTQTETRGHRTYGSIDYIGEKNYLGFPCDCITATTINCENPVQSYDDQVQKGIGIIHYTNNTISNFYGEFFFIDTTRDKNLIIDLPTVMWHHRIFSGSTTGNKIGMRFVSGGDLQTVENTNIEFYNLIEDSTMSLTPDNPLVVGRIYPQLKIVAISDEELLAAMSFKSNRNWTLPKLHASLTTPSGSTIGLLAPNETMFLTYGLQPNSGGFAVNLPCQKYIKITNNTPTTKDVYFTLNATGELPYMQKVEDPSYNGYGFYAEKLELLAQKVSDANCRPDPASWQKIIWSDVSNETLNPLIIEDQNPATNDFLLTGARYSSGTIYDNAVLGIADINTDFIMNFGDERFFYGNIDTYIGAKIFKTVFSLNVNSTQFTTTTNPTYGSSNNILNISDIGIYDNYGDLVMIGKISTPVELPSGSVANIEMTLDF